MRKHTYCILILLFGIIGGIFFASKIKEEGVNCQHFFEHYLMHLQQKNSYQGQVLRHNSDGSAANQWTKDYDNAEEIFRICQSVYR